MKNTVRARLNGATKPVSAQTKTSHHSQSLSDLILLPSHHEEIDSTIDPELREICAEFSADKRKYMAEKLHRWASDLERTAALLAWFENHNPNTPWHAAN